ncbi:hypothetical protein SAMN05216474_1615 [Lishizhenia tianjinensis]|uniref:Transposase zinc-ribbon domain-containing protein n=1 Tax=Lishizhenia tianjinensis TaxID=477690 RepID=A0A1I6ZTQ9_9FLAO|nr:hypothetical protein [Lishizhenia tianjinensis]SFT66074.1 hypothetical protein SAMN05216474_1615 [Lishizhenia tianjinensis]
MNQSEFYGRYNREENAVLFFKEIFQYRVKCCPKCKHHSLKFYMHLKSWRCPKCKKIISIKSVSFMRDSNLQLRDWLEIIYLITQGKKTDSVLNLLRKSRQTRYDTLAYAVKKLRLEMGQINKQLLDQPKTLLHFEKRETESIIDLPGIPQNIDLQILKQPFKNYDRIRLTLSSNDVKEVFKLKSHRLLNPNYRYKKLFAENVSKPTTLNKEFIVLNGAKIKKTWEQKLKTNFIKELRGIYHNVSIVFMQGVMDEYCFKYNNRHSLTPKFKVFVYQLLMTKDRIAGSQ